MKQVILILISITGRRSSETIACAFIKAVLKTLEEKYTFLKDITVKDLTYHEGVRESAIIIKPNFNTIKPDDVGDAIESLIRVLCMDLEEDTGLYFIQELKDRLDDKYVSELKKMGSDLELLRLEQRHLHEQLERKKAIIHHDTDTADSEIQVDMINYSWQSVASFKYRNNLCFLYDKNGKLLDKLDVNKLIEYYVRTLTDFGKLVLKEQRIQMTDKQIRLLQLVYDRDIDEESAVALLHVTPVEFNHMIQQLLRYEYLQYISYDEIKLTEKGVEAIEEKTKKPIQEVSS